MKNGFCFCNYNLDFPARLNSTPRPLLWNLLLQFTLLKMGEVKAALLLTTAAMYVTINRIMIISSLYNDKATRIDYTTIEKLCALFNCGIEALLLLETEKQELQTLTEE